jgi:hypothetical protein
MIIWALVAIVAANLTRQAKIKVAATAGIIAIVVAIVLLQSRLVSGAVKMPHFSF